MRIKSTYGQLDMRNRGSFIAVEASARHGEWHNEQHIWIEDPADLREMGHYCLQQADKIEARQAAAKRKKGAKR